MAQHLIAIVMPVAGCSYADLQRGLQSDLPKQDCHACCKR